MMESLRKDLAEDSIYPLGAYPQSMMNAERSSWHDMQKVFCQGYPRATYIDLEGAQQACP
jgi:hypothetical protein